ncbi:RNA ligase/cyclic nucleotide phosphodiesterase [Polychytrium aggregatum]|uniref:RNA ligase/cyclic nucleotide phosphodiesterase n=1 Tax=Polychytrium aggregatum TaxID=110093 RepID=UPI0022FE44B1|nr:RNA ligase/cyclic nucleotide phosphodiesterase [Polychytrium aggregatum]KAI9208578.1 RNA ligase/cyclic nucleotide phosphodiesterase [Polychytrium aggregatum]
MSYYERTDLKAYSLWLVPSDPAIAARLGSIIGHYSRELDTPLWSPHITLLGGIASKPERVRDLTAQVAKAVPPFRVKLEAIAIKDMFFQCVMAVPGPSDALVRLNEAAREGFGQIGAPEYWPHLSLVYGDLEHSVKQRVADEIKRQSTVVGIEFEISSVQIWSMEGEIKDWALVAEFPLGS